MSLCVSVFECEESWWTSEIKLELGQQAPVVSWQAAGDGPVVGFDSSGKLKRWEANRSPSGGCSI